MTEFYMPSHVPSIKTFVFFLKPEVPGVCPSMGFVGIVSTVRSASTCTIARHSHTANVPGERAVHLFHLDPIGLFFIDIEIP